ncbi:hypothetical protein GPA10_18245 [Streptomyces sp. p1417]|uniref:Uncharacterized protein n=1 Tax=Streptomyces typhae TaxID=2681492 RepID=A0A6L6WYQ0_9ACTN|nr:hypothetical protein [Streptomyces typhae]MVO86645.1 hypothetical protein [Streptomyces typhae]
MSTAPRFRRQKPVEQYGTLDVRQMTPEEIVAADEAGHLDALNDGGDPDATVEHKPSCKGPDVGPDDEGHRSIRAGDPVTYVCANCHARKEI